MTQCGDGHVGMTEGQATRVTWSKFTQESPEGLQVPGKWNRAGCKEAFIQQIYFIGESREKQKEVVGWNLSCGTQEI